MDELRLDLYLVRCRLIKRRSLAQAACAAGLILVGGSPVRAGRKLRVGDRVVLRHGGRLLELEALHLPRRGERVLLGEDLPYRILSSSPLPGGEERPAAFGLIDLKEFASGPGEEADEDN